MKAHFVVVQGAKTLVSMKCRYPNGGRLVSRIEAGFKGAGTPFCSWSSGERLVRIQTAKGWSMGFGEREFSHIGATRLNAFYAPTAKRDATGEVPTVSLAKMWGRTNQRFRTTHTSCERRKAISLGFKLRDLACLLKASRRVSTKMLSYEYRYLFEIVIPICSDMKY